MKTLIVLLVSIGGVLGEGFSYEGEKGPANWGGICTDPKSARQSPINVVSRDAEYKDLGSISISNQKDVDCVLTNKGHTVNVEVGKDSKATMSGGGLPGTFKLVQFHFHWGKDDTKGSEHQLNGKSYPLEAHFVYINSKYATPAEAMVKSDGVGVLGFFFKVGAENKAYNEVINALENVKYENSPNHALPKLDIPSLMGDVSGTMYRYLGSLTTPPCYESVIWTVFDKPIEVSVDQIKKFRMLYEGPDANSPKMLMNHRPVQELGSRKLYTNQKSGSTDNNSGDNNSGSASTFTCSMIFISLSVIMNLFL